MKKTEKTMKKITINKEHKIYHNTSASNCNITILFVMVDKNLFVGIFWHQCHERVKIVDRLVNRFRSFESINRLVT